MSRRVSVLIAFIALLVTDGLAAPRRISLEEAIAQAIKTNKDVAVASLAVNKAEAQIEEAIGNALPTLNLAATYTRNLQLPVFFIPDFSNPTSGKVSPVTIGLDNQYSFGLQAQQILFNSAVFTGIGASRIYRVAAQERLNSVIATVVTDTKKRYYGAMLAREFVTIMRASLKNGEENLANIQLLLKEGLVAEFDAIRADVGVENIRPMVTQAEAGYATAVSALSLQLGLDIADTLEPAGTFPTDLAALDDEDAAIARAMKENYDIKALEVQEAVTKEFIAINQADYYPTLAAFGSFQNQGQSNTFDNWVSASSTAVGLSLSMNLFNGLRSKAKVQQSQVDFESVRTQVAQAREGVKLQVRATRNMLLSARQRVLAQQRTVEQAERGYAIAQIRYREGTGSLLEMNDADLALAQARTNKIQALHDYHAAVADLDRLTGALDRSYFVTVNRD